MKSFLLLLVVLLGSGARLFGAAGEMSITNTDTVARYVYWSGGLVVVVPARTTITHIPLVAGNAIFSHLHVETYPTEGVGDFLNVDSFDFEGLSHLDYEWWLTIDPYEVFGDVLRLRGRVPETAMWMLLVALGVGLAFGWCVVAPLEVN